MAIIKDLERLGELKKTVGRRLKAARKAAGVTESEAAAHIDHKGITQISLAESGERLLPLTELIKLCNLYVVPLDYVCGLIDDPIPEPEEHREAVIARSVDFAIKECFERFSSATSQHVALAIAGQRQDRIDLIEIGKALVDVESAMARFRELNPEFDEDMRGSAKLVGTIRRLREMVEGVVQRIDAERRKREVIETSLELDSVNDRVEQFRLQLTT